MIAGAKYNLTVVMQNTGTSTWPIGSTYQLGAINPVNNTTWGVSKVNLAAAVAPNAKVTITIPVVAPATPGAYNCQWQMVHNGVAFGDPTTNVNVFSSKPANNNAAFVSQVVPTTMVAGKAYNVTVTMKNTGVSTWTKDSLFQLGALDLTWGKNRFVLPALPTSVPPGGTATFVLAVKAPATKGTYNFQWRMIQLNVGWFGANSTNLPITVQ